MTILHKNKRRLDDKKDRNMVHKLKDIGLTQGKDFINNNLCPYNKFLWGKCKQLHSEKLIDRFWVFNGYLHIANNENDKKGIKIVHMNTLREIFPGFDFETRLRS